jgi:hypothetical protein
MHKFGMTSVLVYSDTTKKALLLSCVLCYGLYSLVQIPNLPFLYYFVQSMSLGRCAPRVLLF